MENVYIRSYDGAYLLGRLYLPGHEGPYPGLVHFHGGRGGQAVDGGDVPFPDRVFAHLLREGYAVLCADYRRYHFADEELEDAVAAYRYLKSRPELDPSRIAVTGSSHGGYIALMLATKEEPAAVCVWAGLVDAEGIFYERSKAMLGDVEGNWEAMERWYHNGHTIREESRLIDSGKLVPADVLGIGDECAKDLAYRWGDRVELFRAYSPKEQHTLIEAPLLFVVGSEDGFNVEGRKLVESLQADGKDATYSEHPGVGHGFWSGGERDESGNIVAEYYRALDVATRFLNRHLKAAEQDIDRLE